MDNILFIPGIANPVSEINSLLFGQGQQGTFIAPSLTPSLISGSTFGTGVETLTDLSPRNNPFSQATSGNRAAWFREPKTGARQIYTWSEDLSNAAWSKVNGAVIAPNDAVAPNGTLTADLLTATGAGFSTARQLLTLAAGTYVVSFHVRRRTGTGAIQLTINGVDWTTISVTGSWARYSISLAFAGGSAAPGIRAVTSGDAVEVWGAQLELGSTPTAYQRVTTAFDVTESGQRDCYGVRADGIDDGYATAGNVDFSGTDKVTVFAAVRKLSDAATANICELGSASNRFILLAPSGAGANSYRMTSQGDGTLRSAGTGIFASAPDTAILTGFGDISGPLVSLRRNGVEIASSNLSQGAGNYASGILYMLFNGTTSFFNGRLYALIVAGGSYPLSTIQRVERLLSRITPTVNL
jgi:hypothetical protein